MKFKKFLSCFLVAVLMVVGSFSLPFGVNPMVKQVSAASKTTYPTAWVPLTYPSHTTSAKLKKAGKAILASTIAGLIPGVNITEWAGVVAGILLDQFYVNSDEQDVWFNIQYSYRELSAGHTDNNGTYYGDYQVRIQTTAYSDSAMKKQISSNTQYISTTTLVPYMGY
ncbi:MAG: hypothetical protein K0R05_2415 [Anaerocolumna sp.]|jgi:hypothetical protein|nr:hypothetical protein [Anaerocolumna sp.]